MNRNHFWKLVLTCVLLGWAIFEMYPPAGRSLVQVFKEKAIGRDVAFSNIVYQVDALQKKNPEREYGNLVDAIGTNQIAKYFPFYNVKEELNPTAAVLNRLQRDSAGRIRLGLDLRGGTSFLVEMQTNALAGTDSKIALSQAVEVLRKRVDKFGVAEPVIQPQGEDRILVQLPGLSQAEKESAMRTIQQAAFLEFRLVSPTSEQDIREGIIPPGYQVLRKRDKNREGKEVIEELVVRSRHEMDGSSITKANVFRNPMNGEFEIHFNLSNDGAKRFGQITRENIKQRLAIILDGQLYSAPVIQSAIETGSGQITGNFDSREAWELANILENPLRAPLKFIESREVDPTLGRDSINSGIKATIIGTVAVVVFMLVYYLLSGAVANVALLLNIIITLGLMASLGATLTMPGIAGIVLSIGMAVDANVLIFERIREEMAAGKSMRGALSSGYSKAFGTIFDSNLTTLITSVILIVMGTGPIKGFGVTLTIGVSVSMFTALVVTRLMFDWLIAKNWIKNLNMLNLVKASNIDFMKFAIPAFILSWSLVIVGNGYGIYRGRDVMGVELTGGNTITMNFDKRIDVDDLRKAAAEAKVGEVMIAYQRDISTRKENLRVTTRTLDPQAGANTEAADKLIAQLQKSFPAAKFEVQNVDRVGPTVGAEIRNTAIVSTLLALFGILVYVAFRYEFSFAVGAVIAIIHDVFMTLGWYFLTGRELNATTVAALLTIIGFSINDTIVIFDRIREDLKLGVRGTFRDVINKALNQTLSRTIITSGTVLLATLSLYIFGGGVINDFAFTFLVGILTGTYSTIYIATFLVLKWHKGQRPAIGENPMPLDPGASKTQTA